MSRFYSCPGPLFKIGYLSSPIRYKYSYTFTVTYLHQCCALSGHWTVDNIDLFWTLEYQIRLLWTQRWCNQPSQSVKQPILPPPARRSFPSVSALCATALTWLTLTPNGVKTENFGELARIITSVSKVNKGHQISLKRWNNGNPVEMKQSEKKVKKSREK